MIIKRIKGKFCVIVMEAHTYMNKALNCQISLKYNCKLILLSACAKLTLCFMLRLYVITTY